MFRHYAVNATTTPLNVDDLIICRSDRSGVAALSISVHEFAPEAPAAIFPEQGAYCFWYRPRTEKGEGGFKDTFYPATVQNFTVEGKIYGVPTTWTDRLLVQQGAVQ